MQTAEQNATVAGGNVITIENIENKDAETLAIEKMIAEDEARKIPVGPFRASGCLPACEHGTQLAAENCAAKHEPPQMSTTIGDLHRNRQQNQPQRNQQRQPNPPRPQQQSQRSQNPQRQPNPQRHQKPLETLAHARGAEALQEASRRLNTEVETQRLDLGLRLLDLIASNSTEQVERIISAYGAAYAKNPALANRVVAAFIK